MFFVVVVVRECVFGLLFWGVGEGGLVVDCRLFSFFNLSCMT